MNALLQFIRRQYTNTEFEAFPRLSYSLQYMMHTYAPEIGNFQEAFLDRSNRPIRGASIRLFHVHGRQYWLVAYLRRRSPSHAKP